MPVCRSYRCSWMAKIGARVSPSKQVQQLTLPLIKLKGIGPQRASLLARKGLNTILDLLFFLPFRYEDRTRLCSLAQIRAGERVLVKGQVVYAGEEGLYRSRKRVFKIIIREGAADLELTWFHYRRQYLARFIQPGKSILAYGPVISNRSRRQIVHPEISLAEEKDIPGLLGFFPVYSIIEGLSANALRKLIHNALETYLPVIVDPLPPGMTRRLGLPSLPEALQKVHHPRPDADIVHLNQHRTPAHRRLSFDRFFLVMLGLIHNRRQRSKRTAPIITIDEDSLNTFQKALPFSLTRDQAKAMEDVRNDFRSGRPMFRLLQGDVGCGKTVIAAMAAYAAARNNRQAALMAPTRILAGQHLEFFQSLSGRLGLNPLLLLSGQNRKEREKIHEKVRSGACDLVIGTHSLLQEELVFKELGLVIIDEQQRFGVRQRALIGRKAHNPHQLIMTATPIPRTLAVTLYGDMDITVIKSRPLGQKPVETRLIPRERKREVFGILRSGLSFGRQAFVICPVIEGPEETGLKDAGNMASGLRKILSPDFKVGLVHGRLSGDEREKIMEAFRRGEIHILVGTTVLEVGIDVPNATLMIIEHPERFGLAQLHQLRGRVGRGREKGLCLMIVDDHTPPKAAERLKIIEECRDGFAIAEKDLELRGHGQLIGLKQSGPGEIDLDEILNDPELLLAARQEAQDLIRRDPDLLAPEHGLLKAMVTSTLVKPLDM